MTTHLSALGYGMISRLIILKVVLGLIVSPCNAQAPFSQEARRAIIDAADLRLAQLSQLKNEYLRVKDVQGADSAHAWEEVYRSRSLALRAKYATALAFLIKARREARTPRAQEVLAVEIGRVLTSSSRTSNDGLLERPGLEELGKARSALDGPVAEFVVARAHHYSGSMESAQLGYQNALAKLNAHRGSNSTSALNAQFKLHLAELLLSDQTRDTIRAKVLIAESNVSQPSPFIAIGVQALHARLAELRGHEDSAGILWKGALESIEHHGQRWALPDVQSGSSEVAVPQSVMDAPYHAVGIYLARNQALGVVLEAGVTAWRNATVRNDPGALSLLRGFRSDNSHEQQSGLLSTLPILTLEELHDGITISLRRGRDLVRVPVGLSTHEVVGTEAKIIRLLCSLPQNGALPPATVGNCRALPDLPTASIEGIKADLTTLLLPTKVRQKLLQLPVGSPLFIQTTPPFHTVPFGTLWLDDAHKIRLDARLTPVLVARPSYRLSRAADLVAFRHEATGRSSVFMNDRYSAPVVTKVDVPSQPSIPVPSFPTQDPLPAAAQRHASAVAQILHAQLVSGPGATAGALRNALASSRTVHIVAHGLWNGYLDGGLIATQTDNISGAEVADGLSAREIAASSVFEGALVTMSSCESAVAHPRDPLSRSLGAALVEGGAAVVIGTLWKVTVPEAAAFMEEFHRQLTSIPGSDEFTAFFGARRKIQSMKQKLSTDGFVLLRGYIVQ